MAEKVILVDDLDGAEGGDVAKRDFEVLGQLFTIDLSEDNHKALEETLETLAQYVEKARDVKQAGRARKAADASPRIKGYGNTEVREWAKENGVEVSSRGKIGDDVYDAFIAAHPDAKPDA